MHPLPPANTPRILWVELTSKCPFDCIFCSRQTRRGSGEHMPFRLFKSLVAQVEDPRKFLLNYSGESTLYPDLIPAVRLARSTGAAVELVSALASAPETLLFDLSRSGLTRLTVSVHAAHQAAFQEIYRHSSWETLRTRLTRFLEFCWEVDEPPAVDLAFVAMDRNLAELSPVAALAASLGLRAISIFPVIRRDEIPVSFPQELTAAGEHRGEFRDRLNSAVEQARQSHPEIAFTVCNPAFTVSGPPIGAVPAACPGDLPAGARIHSCEQNPWETAHVLSNGDIVPCEVHDRSSLGNLARQSLREIWHGAAYREFRQRYFAGSLPACRACPWKRAYLPGPLESDIVALRGPSAQLAHGWHEPAGEQHIWASRQAAAILQPRPGSRTLHVSGVLPPGAAGAPNELTVWCNGATIGSVVHPGREPLHFGVDLPVAGSAGEPWSIQFRSRHSYRAKGDQRDLGFALVLLASKPPSDAVAARRGAAALEPLLRAIHAIDAAGRIAGRALAHAVPPPPPRFAPGISVLIPERDNPAELSLCLAALRDAARQFPEPVETIVVVNGSAPADYAGLRDMYPLASWRFHPRPMSFSAAIAAGLRHARYDWVYLLNNDVALSPDALVAAAAWRAPGSFSVASQILLRDRTRFRDETNLTTLFLERGLATIHDLIPQSGLPVEHFYAGGGASLFQTSLLRRVLDRAAYRPFYWEDVEWGWRARKLGYRSVFCPQSVAIHRRRSTIARHYPPAEVETIVERHRYLFQLRNFTAAGPVEDVLGAIAGAPPAVMQYFLGWQAAAAIVRGRLWNHRAPIPDARILEACAASLSLAAGTDPGSQPRAPSLAGKQTTGACD